jgi:hypothetical protein
LQQRQRLLHGEQQTLQIHVKLPVKMFFTDLIERRKRACASVGKEDVKLALLRLRHRIQLVQISQFGDVALKSSDTVPRIL